MTNGKAPDIVALHTLYEADSSARVILDHLAGFQRNRRETSVDRLLSATRQTGREEVPRGEIVRVLKEFERLGCGTFVPGRWSRPSRFQWAVNLTDVGRAASGEETRIEPVSDEAAETDEEDADIISHTFVLRPGCQITLDLPADLSVAEASRLAELVKTLPFVR